METDNTTTGQQDPVKGLKELFIDKTMGPRIVAGQCPVRRAVFSKPHGVVNARFIIDPDLPSKYRVGIFKGTEYDAWLRFSSDTQPGVSDLKKTVGVGMKLFGVEGDKLLPGHEHENTADFLLQNFNIFFVDTAADMYEFTYAGVVKRNYDDYLATHPETKRILDLMEAQKVKSCFTTSYWSGLPYAFGNSNYVKYKLEPVSPPFAAPLLAAGPDYLADDLKARMLIGEMQFKFMVQFRTDPDTMPLDKATVEWDEAKSPFIQLATLIIFQQDIGVQGQMAYGENLSFNPWRTLKEHQPIGSISEARKTVYQAGADLRHHKNGIADSDPSTPRHL